MPSKVLQLYPKCPFCDKKLVSARHLEQCSAQDAEEKLSEQCSDRSFLDSVFGQIVSAKVFSERYDAASSELKNLMWVCTECYDHGFILSSLFLKPKSCARCGCESIEPALAFVTRLIEEENSFST
jgi:hypothetical protein